jgi:hypothetical protein
MRKLLLLLIIPLLFACEEDGFKVKPGAQFRIEPVISSKQSAPAQEEDTIHLSHLEIVKQAVCIVMYYFDTQTETYQVGRGGFSSKDTVSAIPALLQNADQIIALDGALMEGYITAYDMVIERTLAVNTYDTIAYIPNAQMRASEILIREAYANKNAAIYDLFNNAFKFIPITGAEWKELKAANLN